MRKRPFKTSLWIAYLSPLVLIVLTVVVLISLSIRDTLHYLGDGYAKVYSQIILNVSIENSSALVTPTNCEYLQQALRYEREIFEMQIVADKEVICSSLGHVNNSPIVNLELLEQTEQKVVFATVQRPNYLSVAVINKRVLKEQEYYAVSLIDLDYLRANMGYRTDTRLESAALFIGTDDAPHNVKRDAGWFSYMAQTEIPEHRIQVIASGLLIKEKVWFFFFAAIPGTLAVYIGFYYVRLYFNKHQGIHNELKLAIQRKEFILHYQPQVNGRNREICGVEALVRWIHPERGLLYPDVFIPILEEFGLIEQLTDVVVERAVNDFSSYSFTQPFHLGINFPPDYFLFTEKQQYLVQKADLLGKQGVLLGLEITERQLLDERAKSAIEQLREFGLEVLIDDFGTGQTSLAMLETTPIDYLKIDKCFVDTIGSESVSTPVLDAIISMAQALDLKLIAEGVEEQSQADYLIAKGVVIHQGYFYSKPVALEELTLSTL
ncbi:EAL domain-containing protein [Vibrio aestuarianus]|uniref:EAL domain-containing protein n=1 Tax=Vibrio aestuarianus TaxID=28171 RepID=UPI00155968F8|nr:EAL domain-containing protein [Vibrio aestuarianus]NGZ14160.1 EAL domain-containing protein [Vibrio aestuarianus]NKZ50308.1 EAL domain-containing protein [Vibrio aestuarianus]